MFSGRLLYLLHKSLEDYDIPNDATLRCVSFRATGPEPMPSTMYIGLKMVHEYGRTLVLEVKSSDLVRDLKEGLIKKYQSSDFMRINLVYGDSVLEDQGCLDDYGIKDGSTLSVRVITVPKEKSIRVKKNVWDLYE